MSAADIGTCEWAEVLSDGVPEREPGWVLVDPSGRVKGLREFGMVATTAEQAHRRFTPGARDRDREIREGWVVRREQPGDREAFKASIEEGA